MTRRTLLGGLAGLGAAAFGAKAARDAAAASGAQAGAQAGAKTFPFTLPEQEWARRLSPEAYRVLRGHGTERAFTSPLNTVKGPGLFHCAGCDHPLFDAATKYDSGTGWPSFWDHLPDAIGTAEDRSFFMVRVEVHCANCGGHLGHVFEDGPPPTGLRYCMNGVAMTFKPGAKPAAGSGA